MKLLIQNHSYKSLISILLILLVVLFRFIAGGFNWSYFIVLGDQFVSDTTELQGVLVQEGPGYDGQFYYALATDPFLFEDSVSGVQIDHPLYRHQRILYPLLVFLASFGMKPLIPFMMLLINAISVFVISSVVSSYSSLKKIKWTYLTPFLISGLWMSLSRNLTECLEIAFLVLTLSSLMKNKLGYFVLFSSAALLTRETSIIYIAAMSLIWLRRDFSLHSAKKGITNSLFLIIPLLLLIAWKYNLLVSYSSDKIISAGSNITMPFKGLYMSFVDNFKRIDSTKSLIEFFVWLAFIIWQIWLFILGIKSFTFKFKTDFLRSTLSVLVAIGIGFASIFSISIYIDDWAFLRVLAALSLFIIILILEHKSRLPKWFLTFTILLTISTVVRIIFRV